MTHLNYKSYQKVENLRTFTSKSFKDYCDSKIKECSKHIFFLKKNIVNKQWNGKVCEIGSGNGKLLFRLDKEKLINEGVGYEISKSRCKFAKLFKKYVKSKKVIIKNQNFIYSNIKKKKFDLIIGVDIVFNLISAVSTAQAKKLLKLSHQSLRKGGFLVLEIASYYEILKKLKKNKNYKQTFYFNKNDPFKLVHHTYELKKNNKLLVKKKFLSREGYFDFFNNLLIPIQKKFWKNFNDDKTKFLDKWNLKIFNHWKNKNDTKEEYIIVLQKK